MSVTHDKSPTASDLQFLHAYIECSDAIQEGIKEMLAIVFGEGYDDDERAMASATIADSLYPNFHKGKFGMDLEEMQEETPDHVPELRPIVEALNREEAEFAARLKTFMAAKGVNQSALAEMIGVSQPAISLMLKRQCRPQQRTIERLADALDVSTCDLWPSHAEG